MTCGGCKDAVLPIQCWGESEGISSASKRVKAARRSTEMSKLEDAVARLSGLLTPPDAYTNETKIFAPESDDPNAAFKQRLIDQATRTLRLAEFAVAGPPIKVPYLDNNIFDEIQSILEGDHEQPAFRELASAIQSVADAINRPSN